MPPFIKKAFKNHVNAFLVALAVFFSAVVVGYFLWGVGFLVVELNEMNSFRAATSSVPGFDLQGAAALDYRGTFSR